MDRLGYEHEKHKYGWKQPKNFFQNCTDQTDPDSISKVELTNGASMSFKAESPFFGNNTNIEKKF